MRQRLTPDLKTDLLDNHWRKVYNWNEVDDNVLRYLSDRWQCSVGYIKSVMREIERAYPKPKHKDAATCPKCKRTVIYIGKHACEPPVVSFVAADETIHKGRVPHVCRQWQGQAGIEASVGK